MHTSFPVLDSDRLRLIEFENNHSNELYELFSDPRVTKFYNIEPFTSVLQAEMMIGMFKEKFKELQGMRWAIFLKCENRIIGSIGFNNIVQCHKGLIGYDLMPEYWNQGITSKAVELVVEFGFNRFNFTRIEAEVMPGNFASESVLKKNGFQREGVLRNWRNWNGKYYDLIMYSLLKKEFLKEG